MSRDGRDPDQGRGQLSPEERESLRARASNLGRRLEAAKAPDAPSAIGPSARGRALGDAFKIVADLVVGVAVGCAMGWALDRLLGTRPWLLVLFLVLGFAAGVSNVIRTARRMQAEAAPLQRSAKPAADDDEE